jgi:predicted PurR-regulated permease PerM
MSKKKLPQPNKYITNLFFLGVFAGVIALFGKVVLPFLTPIILAILLSIGFYPLHKKILAATKGRDGFAALMTVGAITLLVVIPVTIILSLIAAEALRFYNSIRVAFEDGQVESLINDNIGLYDSAKVYLEQYNISLNIEEQRDNILKVGQSAGLFIYESIGSFIGNIAQFFFNFITMMFVMYYLLKDHKKIARRLLDLSPLPDHIEINLAKRVGEVGKAVFLGNMITALIQGILGGVGFAAFGIGNSIFWGAMIAVSSLIPTVGVFLVTIPASLFFFIQGKWVIGLIFLAYNIGIVGSIDNVLKPKLIESKMKIHPLLVFIGVLGGMIAFGPLGIIYGPLIVAIFNAFVHIYTKHFRDGNFFSIKNEKVHS